MAVERKFGKLVFYVEACESGSMFKNHLPDNINIFATTAANDHESSYACYFDSKRSTYLGDWYSVNWMEDSDRENIEKETLEHQFEVVRGETKQSHCQQFGSMDIANMTVGQFQGLKEVSAVNYEEAPKDPVLSYDVPLKILERQIESAKTYQQKLPLITQLKEILENRRKLKTQMYKMAGLVAQDGDQAVRLTVQKQDLNDIHCHDDVIKHFDQKCLGLGQNTYATRFVYMFVNMCEEGIAASRITEAIDAVCPPLKGINGYYL
jgi:legumain